MPHPDVAPARNILAPAGYGSDVCACNGAKQDTPMPRYLFTVQNSKPEPDRVEMDLAGPEEARSAAIAEAGEMLRDHRDKEAWPSPEWWVHVTDEKGVTVCRLTVTGG